MSPEQARGRMVDRRADVWAFGCILYEMLAGRQTFANGETLTDTLAGVLARDPEWGVLPAATPPKIRALLESCLRKDVRRRLRDLGYARIEIEETGSAQYALAPVMAAPSRWRQFFWPALTALFLLATVGVVLRFVVFAPVPQPPQTVQFDVFLPEGAVLSGQFQLSPDGSNLAFVATSDSKQMIWVRPIASSISKPLAETEGTGPTLFWSADSQYIAFVAQKQLKKIAATGGPAQILCSVPGNLQFGSWNADGVIIMSSVGAGSDPRILRVTGGQLTPLTEMDASLKEARHTFPSFLPDNRHYLFRAVSDSSSLAYIGDLNSGERRPLPGIGLPAQATASGHIFFTREGSLLAQRFDLERLELLGEPDAIDNISIPATTLSSFLGNNLAAGLFLSASKNKALAYRPGQIANSEGTELVWFDHKGTLTGAAGPKNQYRNPGVSPDGKHIAFEKGTPPDIWVLDVSSGVTTKLTSDVGPDTYPIWSPDGRSIVFASTRDGVRGLYERQFNAVGEDKLLAQVENVGPDNWSRDGRFIVYDSSAPQRHIWAIPMTGDRKPFQATRSQFEERGGRTPPMATGSRTRLTTRDRSSSTFSRFPNRD